jgi:hypothetical protein
LEGGREAIADTKECAAHSSGHNSTNNISPTTSTMTTGTCTTCGSDLPRFQTGPWPEHVLYGACIVCKHNHKVRLTATCHICNKGYAIGDWKDIPKDVNSATCPTCVQEQRNAYFTDLRCRTNTIKDVPLEGEPVCPICREDGQAPLCECCGEPTMGTKRCSECNQVLMGPHMPPKPMSKPKSPARYCLECDKRIKTTTNDLFCKVCVKAKTTEQKRRLIPKLQDLVFK